MQLEPGAKVAPVQLFWSVLKNQVPIDAPAPDATAALVTVTAANKDVFVRVTVPVPVPMLRTGVATVMLSGFGVTGTVMVLLPVALSSTAPASTGLFGVFRRFPKKSLSGAAANELVAEM